jgi:hypothetical protein
VSASRAVSGPVGPEACLAEPDPGDEPGPAAIFTRPPSNVTCAPLSVTPDESIKADRGHPPGYRGSCCYRTSPRLRPPRRALGADGHFGGHLSAGISD